MDSKIYEDWFGLTKDEIIESEKSEENKVNILEISEKSFDYKDSKESKEINVKKFQSFLNKKKERPQKQNIIISEIKNVPNKNINVNNKLNNVLGNSSNNNNANKENKKENSLDNEKMIAFKYKIRLPLFDDKNKEGIVKFNGVSNFGSQNNELKHCIYLRTQNDFNSTNELLEYKWTVKILSNSRFIGFGLADKNVVIDNNYKFFSKDEKFYNGVFCLYSIYKEDRKGNQILSWNPNNRLLNNYTVNFPPFDEGQEITLVYNNKYKNLIFTSKYKSKKKLINYRMQSVTSVGGIGRNILTPCIIFYFPGDQIQISNLEVKSLKNI